ncbi:hypothetical protein F53441_870 [Fusarium austroafricanum]|uniref:Alpha-galactosidase n=1 Tax=Fusarium austroafricanum TaxID=2364996 RepID=A0A8H4PDZ1_9HYPO|nr:hypothetical protein F53441_870 [Fusarium austroafricanum]
MASNSSRLAEIDTLDIHVLINDEIYLISPSPNPRVQHAHSFASVPLSPIADPDARGGSRLEMPMRNICCGAHGLSLYITAKQGERSHTLLFDTGPKEDIFEKNAQRLRLPMAEIGLVVVGKIKASSLSCSLQTNQRSEGIMFDQPIALEADPSLDEIKNAGECMVASGCADPSAGEIKNTVGRVIISDKTCTVLENSFLISGEIRRLTAYEGGIPGGVRYEPAKDEWVRDELIMEERFVMCKLKGKGLVIFTGCSHAGLINVARHAKEIDDSPIYAIVGGYHLADASPEKIQQSIKDLKDLEPALLMPGHGGGIPHWPGLHIIIMSALLFTALLASLSGVAGKTAKSPTPPMGWNSYNHYNCRPSESIIKLNAKGLVDLGFLDLGYSIVTVDCGWPSRDRDSKGRLQWNETLFPSGPKALGEYIHGLGLEFGLYSGAGYWQCGSTDIPASLGYEEIDAKSFAEWGGDTLKYDNCYATSKTNMVDASSAEAKSPGRFIKMAAAINETDRDIQYFLCQWGIGEDVPQWAAPLGNSWRMSNDIFNAWRAIWRITNQVVAHAKYNGPGAFADMDMLIIGLGALSHTEEQFHFGFWSMMKSPLIIGGVMDAKQIPAESLEIMSNKEVIAINQDPLAKAAELVIRYTEEEWDVWAGNLSSNRKVLGVANWKNETQTVKVDLSLIGVGEAKARDVWAHKDLTISGTQEFKLAPHELRQLVLSDISPASRPKSAGYYSAAAASLEGSASVIDCKKSECLPVNKKVGSLGKGSKATFKSVSAPKNGPLYLGVDFINHEYHHTIGDWETNSRNMSISVNGQDAKRWAFPNAGGDWFESDRLTILVDGFKKGKENTITFTGSSSGSWAPDLVGFEVLE